MILAGDVGGTKVDLALCKFDNGQLLTVHDHKYHARDFPGLVQIVEAFLVECKQTLGQPVDVLAACFGVPGPVRHGRLKLTNLPWILDSDQLRVDLKIEHVFLINDLEANGYGVAELTPDQILVLSKGDPAAEGNRGLIAAGTGLGEAILVWNGHSHLPMASEGGHSDFAARNEEEIGLLRYLQKTVGWPRQLRARRFRPRTGQCLRLLSRCERVWKNRQWLKDRMRSEDPNAVIGELGESGASELCVETLEYLRVCLRGGSRQPGIEDPVRRRYVRRRRHCSQAAQKDAGRYVHEGVYRQRAAE
jgi:glucokinase